MALGHALLLLTLMADGGVRMTLSESASAEACETSRTRLTAILKATGHPPILAVCGQTRLRLTPYVHGTPASAETLRYRVQVGPDGAFSVEPVAGGAACTHAPDATPAVYCARSAQRPAPGRAQPRQMTP